MNRIRSILFTIVIALAAVLISIVAFPAAYISGRAARRVVQNWARFSLWAMKYVAGVSYRLEGRENLPKAGALIVSNHQSLWETIALFALLANPLVILKKELLKIPVYGWWAKKGNNIIIDRDGGAQELRRMRKEAADRIANGGQVVVFPEGTRLNAGETEPYKPGIAGVYTAIDAPCVPVAHDAGRFWQKLGGDLTPGVITIRILDPIAPGLDRKEFQRLIETRINNARPDLADNGAADKEGRPDAG